MGKTLAKGMGPQAVGRRVGATEAPSPGLFPRLTLVNIFSHNLGSECQHAPIKFADDTKLGSNISLKGWNILQEDLVNQSNSKGRKFSSTNNKVIHLGTTYFLL